MLEIIPIALGEIGLEYDYFMDLTPRLWDLLLKGYIEKKKEQRKFIASMTAHIMNSSGNMKHLITAEDLLGTENKKSENNNSEPMNFDDLERYIAK